MDDGTREATGLRPPDWPGGKLDSGEGLTGSLPTSLASVRSLVAKTSLVSGARWEQITAARLRAPTLLLS